jgi:hypothetical protein
MQLSVGSLTFQKLRRFSGARIAPIGHKTLQKARRLKITARRTTSNIVSFTRVARGRMRERLVKRWGRVT